MQEPHPQRHGGHGEVNASLERRKAFEVGARHAAGARRSSRRGNLCGRLKAFDFSGAFEPGQNTVAVLQAMTTAYANERSILEHCKARRLTRVVVALDSGEVQVPGLDQMHG